jgi:hypothetical protein
VATGVVAVAVPAETRAAIASGVRTKGFTEGVPRATGMSVGATGESMKAGGMLSRELVEGAWTGAEREDPCGLDSRTGAGLEAPARTTALTPPAQAAATPSATTFLARVVPAACAVFIRALLNSVVSDYCSKWSSGATLTRST